MQVFISNPFLHTQLFTLVLLIVLALSIKSRTAPSFAKDTTQELKGIAILAIIVAHVGYLLATVSRFLFPLSFFAGVGVDLFLFLSGFGLTMSALMKPLAIVDFYQKRLKKIFIPLWITLALILSFDALFLHLTYSASTVLYAFLGWFPRADAFLDINSPLWYISLIVFYYLLYPLVFSHKYPLASALGVYGITYGIVWMDPSFLSDVIHLYEIHLIAFPLGIVLATYLYARKTPFPRAPLLIHSALFGALIMSISYLAIHSGVGKEPWIAQIVSIITMLLVVILFAIKRFEVRLLSLMGAYSFEIYLLHWPILSRYDIFFSWLPAWIALALYFPLILGLAYLLYRIDSKI